MRTQTCFRRMLALAAMLLAPLAMTAEESKLAAFQAAFPEKEAIEIAAGNGEVFSDMIEFPALPAKPGMTPVLKADIRMVSKVPSGWNQFCVIELNGKYLGEKTAAGTLRLLGRGSVMQTSHHNDKDKRVPYWKPGKRPMLLVLFAPKAATTPEVRVLSSRELAYEYYFDISDLVSTDNAVPNRLRFLHRLAKSIADCPLCIQHLTIGYVPTEMLPKLNAANE